MYTYKAHVTAVYDGDSITVDIDLGFKTILKGQKIRLYGIDCEEMNGGNKEKALASRDYLRSLILDKDIVIRTYKDSKGKYGRWLGELFIGETSINDEMIRLGYAVKYE